MTATGLGQVQARIAQIEARFAVSRPPQAMRAVAGNGAGALAAAGPEFAAALAAATADPTAAGPPLATAGALTGPKVIDTAMKYLGVPYRWGGTDPATGLDCSGFVQQVYEDLGVKVPRVSRDQAQFGTPVADLASAKPGDLVAFGRPVDHIGIYMGDNKMVVAPRTGDVVKVQTVPSDWTAIRRIVPDAGGVQPAAIGAASMPAGAAPYAALFQAAGAKHGISPAILQSVAKHESNFNPRAVSHAGAQGLMQLMPATARGLGVANPFDPAQAIDGAAALLAGNLKKFGSLDLALAAYNAGPVAVQRHGGIPPFAETQGYVRRILNDLRPEVS